MNYRALMIKNINTRLWLAGVLSIGLCLPASAESEPSSAADLSMPAFYGYVVSKQLRLLDLGFTEEELAEFMAGFKMGFLPGELEGIEARFPELGAFLEPRFAAAEAKESAERKAESATFLQDLEQREGVRKDPSGLFYEIIEPGEGPKPTMDDTVVVHYHGTLIDGTIFDSSVQRGEPAQFPMGGVIPGFSGGLAKIGKGGKAILYIPAELGYGSNPDPRSPIPPDATLIFEVELVDIK